MKILTYIEQQDQKIKRNAGEVLSLARTLTSDSGNIAALIIGKDIKDLAQDVGEFGVGNVYLAEGDEFEKYNVISYSKAVLEAIKEHEPDIILGPASLCGRDLFPRLAARLDSGIITDITAIESQNDKLIAIKPMYAGKCLAEVTIENSERKFLTIRPNVFPASKAPTDKVNTTKLTVGSSDIDFQTMEICKSENEKPDLTEASIIVSGGRAMKNSENYKVLEECAELLGATVGASRAAVDAGYRPHSDQVGQTGKTVNPNLYIACGISGAIQHLAGMRTSKIIFAINSDPDAPIFSIADYGIVADLFEVLPILNQKLKSML